MRLPVTTSLAALAVPGLLAGDDDAGRYRCSDGLLTSGDVAHAAGVSPKAARRAITAYCSEADDGINERGGATLTMDSDVAPHPGTVTRAEMARIVAKKIGIGRFGVEKRVAARRAAGLVPKPKEKRVSTQQHPWKVERHGRSVKGREGGGVVATMACSKCPAAETIPFRQLCGSADMDAKFKQKGWAVDPTKCPGCNRHNHTPRKEAPVATTAAKTSPAAIAAQAKMFGLLQAHFNIDTGCYSGGFSDAKIAGDCGLAVELVAGVRTQAFGELKEPAEIAQLASDIEALSSLIDEQVAPLRTELANLRTRLAEIRRKFSA